MQMHQSLDLSATNDEELSIVGTASEADALLLSRLVNDYSHSNSGQNSPRTAAAIKIRYVNPENEPTAAFSQCASPRARASASSPG